MEQTGAARPGERVLGISRGRQRREYWPCRSPNCWAARRGGSQGGWGQVRLSSARIGDCRCGGLQGGGCGGAARTQLAVFDVYFDNVGGPLLDTVLTRMNHYGRIAVCGLLADYSSGTRTAPREFDQVLMRRLRIEGFFSPDFMHEGPRTDAAPAGMARSGRVADALMT